MHVTTFLSRLFAFLLAPLIQALPATLPILLNNTTGFVAVDAANIVSPTMWSPNATIDLGGGFSTYWPYTRQIPGTEMTFKLNYQSLIGRDKVDAVMSTSEFIIMQKIEYLGEATQLQVDHEGRQTWRNEVDGVRLAVTNLPSRMLVWGNVRDLVKGVGLYCAAQACMFEFSVGDSEVSIGNGSLSQAY